MKILKPKFWSKKYNLISILLLPISFFLQLFIRLKERFTIQRNFAIPVICVGNIYLGGTGKTPLSILIVQELLKNGKRPALIKKYYSDHLDEHSLISNNVNCLFLGKTRSEALQNAENKGHDIAVLDDGFQDFTIKKNLNILCFNSEQLIGNGLTLPSGPLREKITAIKRAEIIIINGKKNSSFENEISKISNKVMIFYSRYLPINIEKFKNKKLFAFAGIGNPNNFFQMLIDNNLNLQKKVSFPDHYNFSVLEIEKMIDYCSKNNLKIITTEKDYFRIKEYNIKNIDFLKIKLDIQDKAKLVNKILNFVQ